MNIRFYFKRCMISELESCINDLNSMKLFNDKDKNILNPIYERDLKKVKNKILPFGVSINEKMF